jgi:hypothetical protein
MSQRSVEQVIGKLVTDEDFRQRFDQSREATLAEVAAYGLELTPVEWRALRSLDVAACARLAGCLDPRLQKVSLRRNESK